MGEKILKNRSFDFAIRIVKLTQFLQEEKKEFILSKQILRSGTAIGALIREAEFGESKLDFTHKLNIALKEANETDYWLAILHETNYLDKQLYVSLQKDCNELIAILAASIKTLRNNIIKEKRQAKE